MPLLEAPCPPNMPCRTNKSWCPKLKTVRISRIDDAVEIFRKIGVDEHGISIMAPKALHSHILISSQSCKIANILKQEMLSLGGDAAVARGSVSCSVDATDILLMGSRRQLAALGGKIEKQPFGLSQIGREILDILDNISRNRFVLKTSRREIVLGEKTLVMGILNVTPDSLSDGNVFFDVQKAIDHGKQMEEEGADLIDIGGESTRPGSKPVSAEEEMQRVLPVIEGLSRTGRVPISVDTKKSSVALRALEAGAEIVNDISALGDEDMALVVRKFQAGLILMHMRGTPENMQTGNLMYHDLMGEIIDYLRDRCRTAMAAGIGTEHLVVDPGIGFGKTYGDNCKILKNISELKILGLPLLIGASRKGFIGSVTGGSPAERLEGTAATVSAAVLNGCHILRVHDVAFMKKVAAMTDAIVRA